MQHRKLPLYLHLSPLQISLDLQRAVSPRCSEMCHLEHCHCVSQWVFLVFQDMVMLNGFGTIVNALGKRVKAYLPQICGTILWRLNNKSAKVRQQAADLISRIAVVMKTCQEEKLMGHLGVVLYEYLGEEYPEVLGSILGALKGIVNVIGMHKMTPPIKVWDHVDSLCLLAFVLLPFQLYRHSR